MMWLIALMWLAVSRCGGVEVTVGEERMFAPLFEEVVLRCRYSSRSSQTPVVQWWYKSYCRGRTADAFGFPQSLLFRRAEPAGSSHLDCSDAARTVRIIASIRDATATLAEHYRDREDISIINVGDSGVYQCKVVISDDPEGTNEAQVELLVLGKVGALDDFLPGFDLDFMPDWVFVALVILGGCCCLLLVGICWCQCCPHSCCCYLPCCCCRQRCCCPQHLYEAGKVARPEPFFISGVPTMLPIVPPSLFQPQMEKNVTGASSLSELSCFPDTDSSTQSCQLVEKKAAPPASDLWVALSSQEQCSQTPPPQRDQAEEHIRWNPRSEHLQRKAFPGSGRGKGRGEGRAGRLSWTSWKSSPCPTASGGDGGRPGGGVAFSWSCVSRGRRGAPHTPPKRDTAAPPPDASRGRGQGDGRGEGDTPSKTSSGKSSDCYLSLSPSNQPKQGVPLQPYCNTRPPQDPTHPPQDPTRTPRTPRTPKAHRGEHGSHQKTVSSTSPSSMSEQRSFCT
ncbi:hypothetical protein ANANG_G00053380 [Anguilla anguilla]|uniref:Ig-like domain-containing protein n=1 Tax=Anguilla anguilla TaxID=7936 RepID=A0A9D3MPE7_ANGAN|nr:hypothetical protein ANANG_G00053380 [Anguilla anguilla]